MPSLVRWVCLFVLMLLVSAFCPLCLIFAAHWLPNESDRIARILIWVMLQFLLIPPTIVVLLLFVQRLREGSKLFLSEGGLSYPALGWFSLGRLKLIHWRDVCGISLSTDDPSSVRAADKICLRLQGGEKVCFALSGLSPEYQE